MKPTEIHFFKSFLLSQKSSILNKSAEFKNEQRGGHDKVTDEAEIASVDLSLNLSLHLQERDRSSLLQIERALGKIADGTFGQCESCGSAIDLRRLKAQPFATLCIACMEEQAHSPTSFH